MKRTARLYDAALGRFLSPDPYVQMPDFTQSFNRYSYCVNNPLIYTDETGEFFGIDDLIAALIGGVVNWVGNGCQFNKQGLTYFGVGLAGGWASLYISPAGGGTLMGGMNSVVRQGFGDDDNWAWRDISIKGVLFDTAIGGVTAGIGSKISGAVTPYISRLTSQLGGKAIQEMVTQGLAGSFTGFTISTGASLLEGDDLQTALGKGWGGAKSGGIGSAIGGLGYGLRQAYKAGENPWTGKQLLSDEVISKFQEHAFSKNRHDDLGLTESQIIGNLKDFVVRNRFNINEGNNVFQGNINGAQKSIIINVHENQIRSSLHSYSQELFTEELLWRERNEMVKELYEAKMNPIEEDNHSIHKSLNIFELGIYDYFREIFTRRRMKKDYIEQRQHTRIIDPHFIIHDSIMKFVFEDKDQITQWGKSLSTPAFVQSREFQINDHNIFILTLDICSGISCPFIYIFRKENEMWKLVTGTQARLIGGIEINVDDDMEKIIFKTSSGKTISELTYKAIVDDLD